MAKNDFIFVDESGDTGYALDPDTGNLLSKSYYIMAALHVSDVSIRSLNHCVATFRFYTGFNRELKPPPEKVVFDRLMGPVQELAMRNGDIFASVVYLDKKAYTGSYLKADGSRPQSALYFRNRILRCLLENHFSTYSLMSRQYELVLDRIDMTVGQVEGLRGYLRDQGDIQEPRYITHADSMYVEGLQIVDNIARGFKNLAIGGRIPQSLSFVSSTDITENRNPGQKDAGQTRPRTLRGPV